MHDLRQAFFGVAIAAVAGLVLGGASKPNLREGSHLDGPQLLSGVSGERSVPGFNQNASWTGYGGQIPDYVIGTDWTQPAYPAEFASAEPDPEPEPARVAYEAPVRPAVAPRYETAPAPPPTYPSLGGDILAGLQAAEPPTISEDAPAEPAPPPA